MTALPPRCSACGHYVRTKALPGRLEDPVSCGAEACDREVAELRIEEATGNAVSTASLEREGLPTAHHGWRDR